MTMLLKCGQTGEEDEHLISRSADSALKHFTFVEHVRIKKKTTSWINRSQMIVLILKLFILTGDESEIYP